MYFYYTFEFSAFDAFKFILFCKCWPLKKCYFYELNSLILIIYSYVFGDENLFH